MSATPPDPQKPAAGTPTPVPKPKTTRDEERAAERVRLVRQALKQQLGFTRRVRRTP